MRTAAACGDTETVRDRVWAGAPLAVRVVAGAAVAVFAYGTAVHVGQLAAGGWPPYRGVPGWLAGYFASLTVLDPAAAVLLACRRRAGLLLGCAVLLSDAAGNGYANYAIRSGQGVTAGRAGQAVVTVLAIALLAMAPRLWPWFRPRLAGRAGGAPSAVKGRPDREADRTRLRGCLLWCVAVAAGVVPGRTPTAPAMMSLPGPPP